MLVVKPILALLAARSVAFAQSSNSGSPSSAASGSPSASSSGAAPSSSAGVIKTTISLPPLYECQTSTWTYTGPVGIKTLGFYVPGTSDWVEQYTLPEAYEERTNGTFSWKCDFPAGLTVAAITNAESSLSLASSLDPAFTFTGDAASPTPGSSSNTGGGGSSTPIGAIVGGVVGGVCGIALIALGLLYLKRKHDMAVANSGDGLSLYSEKRGSMHHSRYGGGPGSMTGGNAPPLGTYFAHDENGNTILMMGYPPHGDNVGDHPQTPPVPPIPSSFGQQQHNSFGSPTPTSPAPKTTAPMGTLPEPMDESAPSVVSPVPPSAPSGPLAPPVTPSRANTQTTTGEFVTPASSIAPFTPRSERDAFLGHQGLDDPSSFSPKGRGQ
ncbi:hypothetical protein JCM11251_002508 [Rhodosporidiobolus azoricus]